MGSSDLPNVPRTSSKPHLSLEWSDVVIAAKILDKNVETIPFYSLFPNPSVKLLLPWKKQQHVAVSFDSATTLQDGELSTKNPTSTLSSLINFSESTKKCHICGRAFNKLTYLKRHILSHSLKKAFKCRVCGWGFHQQCNLKRHMTSHATREGEGFKCVHCDASFSTKSVLSVHTRDAHTKKRFHCTTCGKDFQKKENFRNHLSLHKQNRLYFNCNICGMKFTDEFIWKKHALLHQKGSLLSSPVGTEAVFPSAED